MTFDMEKLPAECRECPFEDEYGGCIVLNKIVSFGGSYTEFDEEWFKAHQEHRRLKWCPLKEDEEND